MKFCFVHSKQIKPHNNFLFHNFNNTAWREKIRRAVFYVRHSHYSGVARPIIACRNPLRMA